LCFTARHAPFRTQIDKWRGEVEFTITTWHHLFVTDARLQAAFAEILVVIRKLSGYERRARTFLEKLKATCTANDRAHFCVEWWEGARKDYLDLLHHTQTPPGSHAPVQITFPPANQPGFPRLVTNVEFGQFVNSGAYENLRLISRRYIWTHPGLAWISRLEREQKASCKPKIPQDPFISDRPILGVSWFEAVAYCNWRTILEITGWKDLSDLETQLTTEQRYGRWLAEHLAFPYSDPDFKREPIRLQTGWRMPFLSETESFMVPGEGHNLSEWLCEPSVLPLRPANPWAWPLDKSLRVVLEDGARAVDEPINRRPRTSFRCIKAAPLATPLPNP
jgi:hypothetical protein